MNRDERISVPRITLRNVVVPKTPMVNIFGVTDRAYDIVDADEPWLLWEDGAPMLWEDGNKILLEQDKMKVWRKRGRK